jgi:hypothetical protein
MTESMEIGWQAQRSKKFNQPDQFIREDFTAVPMSVIKESAQNSIDASINSRSIDRSKETLIDNNGTDIVKMKFQVLKITGKTKEKYLEALRYRHSLKKYLDRLVVKLEKSNQIKDKRDANEAKKLISEIEDSSKPIYLLNITDFNTTGLLGPEDYEEEIGGDKNFWSLMHCLFGSEKEAGGGSWNLGKTSFTYLSRMKTFLASSNLSSPVDVNGEEKYLNRTFGIALQKTASVTGDYIGREKAIESPWTFGIHPKVEEEFPKDEENESIWDDGGELSKDLLIDVLTNKETGTTIQVPFIKNLDPDYFSDQTAPSELDIEFYANTVMTECYKWLWPAILSNKLKIEVEFAEIDNSNLAETNFSVIEDTIELRSNDSEYIQLFETFKEKYKQDPENISNSFEEVDDMELIRPEMKIDSPKGVSKTKIIHKPHLLLKKYQIDLADTSSQNQVALIRSAGIVVKYENFSIPRSDLQIKGILLAGNAVETNDNNQQSERFLRYCEDPAHKEWWSSKSQLSNYYDESVDESEFSNQNNSANRLKSNLRSPIQESINLVCNVDVTSEGEDDYHAAQQFLLDLPGPEVEPKSKVSYKALSSEDEHKCTCTVTPNSIIKFNTKKVNVFKDPKIEGSEIEILSIRKGQLNVNNIIIVDENLIQKSKNIIEVDEQYLNDNKEMVSIYKLNEGDIFDELNKRKFRLGDILFSNRTNQEMDFEVIYKLSNKTVSGFECNWDTTQLKWVFEAKKLLDDSEVKYADFEDIKTEEE